LFTKLRPIISVVFVEVDHSGNNIYDAALVHAAVRVGIVMAADGRTSSVGVLPSRT
jgi:hypothetical protein